MQLHTERSAIQPLAAADLGFIFTKQKADNQLLVNDGETAVIGGLTVTQVTKTRTGIPLLGRPADRGQAVQLQQRSGKSARPDYLGHAPDRRRRRLGPVAARAAPTEHHDGNEPGAGRARSFSHPPGARGERCICDSPLPANHTARPWSPWSRGCPPDCRSPPSGWTAISLRRMQGYGRGARMKIERDRVEWLSGRPRRRDAGLAGRHADPEPRLGELGGRDGRRGRASPASSAAGASPARGPATRTWSASSSTIGSTPATSSSARARGRPPRAWRRARSPGGCSTSSGWRSGATWSRSAESCAAPPSELPVPAQRAPPIAPRSACSTRPSRPRSSRRIDAAKKAGDTLGGEVEVVARGVVVGLGSHVSWDRKLDGRLAGMLMSIPAVKAVEIGLGVRGGAAARVRGARSDRGRPAGDSAPRVRPAIRARGFRRRSNNAGGLEGGITTGEPLVSGSP